MLGLFRAEGSRRGRRDRAVRRGHRPTMEGLEQRIALATDTWTGAVGPSWSSAGNWANGAVPTTGDSLIFPAGAANLANVNNLASGLSLASITIQAPQYALSGNALALTSGLSASYATGTSTYAIPTALTGVVDSITVSSGGTLGVTNILSGSAGLNVTGGGALDLGAANTFTGPTTIGSGTSLVVSGTVGGVQNTGGLLAGNGSVGGLSSVGGTNFPGVPASATSPLPAPGQLTANGNVGLDSASTFAAELDGITPGNGVTGYSQLIANTGAVSLGGATLDAFLGTGFTPSVGNQFIILLNRTGSPISGTFANLPEGGAVTVNGSLLRISYLGTGTQPGSVVLSAVSAPSTTTLQPLQLPTSANQAFTLSAQVTGSQGIPTGTVRFYNGSPTAGGTLLATASVNPATGLASARVASLGNSGASPVLYALYIPTPTSFTYAGSTSAPISFATTTTVTTSSPTAEIGQPVTFTATVAPSSAGAGTPSGSVEFIEDNAVLLGTVPINPATGQASLTTSAIGIGTHTIVAQFLANAPFQNSTSAGLTQTITTAGVVPVLTVVPVVNRHGKVYKFDLVARMETTASVPVSATGTVTYYINGRAFYRTVELSNGTAVLTRPWQRLVNQYAYVRYNGSSTFVASASKQMYLSHRELTLLARQAESSQARVAGISRARVRRHHHA